MKTIFVSSTFVDMQKERDILRDAVAPRINTMARKYNDHIEFCDLRWGINTEDMETESASRKVLEVCLDEIDRSNPPMIILLGERYGWIPNQSTVASIAEKRKLIFDDLRKSVTALEAEYGALNRNRNALVYLRKIAAPWQDIPDIHQAEDEEHRFLLDSLKERLKALPNCTVKTYTVRFENGMQNSEDMDLFADMVTNDLQYVLQPHWEQFALMSEFERERERQWTFIREKNAMFSARYADVDSLMARINGGSQTVLCKGTSGSGKSSLSSRIATKAKDEGWEVLPFIGGLTDESNDAMDVLRNTIYYLEERLQLEHFSESIVQSFSELNPDRMPTLKQWQSRLRELAQEFEKTGNKLLVVVDAVDQLFPDEIRDTCGFIPYSLSKSITFFMTTLPDIELPQKDYYVLRPLTRDDRMQVIDGVLHRFGKELSSRVKEHLLQMDPAENPYYISMAVQRLCMMDSIDFNKVGASSAAPNEAIGNRQIAILEACPDTIEGMCVELFAEAARRIDANLLDDAMNYLAVSRYGLRRSDLAALMGERWNELKFSHFLNYLYEDFQMRTDGRIDFMHKTIRTGLRHRLKDEKSFDHNIVDYLDTLDLHEPIRLDEMPYHLMRGEDIDGFVSYICRYELGEYADPEIIRHAAASVKDVCLADDGRFMLDVIKTVSESDNWNWIYIFWFVINDLQDVPGHKYQEEQLSANLLTAIQKIVVDFDAVGKMPDVNRAPFIERLSDRIIYLFRTMSDPKVLEWAGDTKLALAKKKYNETILRQRLKLFRVYYSVLLAYKGVSDKQMLQKGIEIAQEGAALIDEELMKNLSGAEAAYYGCMGEMYNRFGDYDKCLDAYQCDLELRKRVYDAEPEDVSALLLLVGAYGNVKTAHERYREASHNISAYKMACLQISCLEQVEKRLGHPVFEPGEQTGYYYFDAARLFFLVSEASQDNQLKQHSMEDAIRWIIKGCDLLQQEYRDTGDPEGVQLIVLCYDYLRKLVIPNLLHNEIIDVLKKWIANSEQDYYLNLKDLESSRLFLLALYTAVDCIIHSSITAYFEYALECSLKAISIAESSVPHTEQEKEIVRNFMSEAYTLNYKVRSTLNPKDVLGPLLENVEREEKLAHRFGTPSERLGILYYGLSQYHLYHQTSLALTINTANAALQVYQRLMQMPFNSKDDARRISEGLKRVSAWHESLRKGFDKANKKINNDKN